MKLKKKEALQLEKNSGLYFVFGLSLVLALTYVALEWKSFDGEIAYSEPLNETDFIMEELPPIVKPPKPPKPKFIPPSITELPDETEEMETFFDVPEPSQDTEIEPYEAIVYKKDPVDEEIIFIAVEDKPIFPGCENASDKYVCFQEMMRKHIRKVFRYPETAQEMGLNGKVDVVFTIQKDGSIGNVKMRGPHIILEEEAARIISKLPKMTPGKQRGKAVKVPFSIPITFRLH